MLRNDVKVTSIPNNNGNIRASSKLSKSHIIRKVLSYPKMHFFAEFEPLCQNLWAFMSNFVLFYHNHSPNMVILRDSSYKF